MADMGTPMSSGFSGGDFSKDDIIRMLSQLINALGGNAPAYRKASTSNRSENEQPKKVTLDPKSLSSIEKWATDLFTHTDKGIKQLTFALSRTPKNDPQRQLMEQLLAVYKKTLAASTGVTERVTKDRDDVKRWTETLEHLEKIITAGAEELKKAQQENADPKYIQSLKDALDRKREDLVRHKSTQPSGLTDESNLKLQELVSGLVQLSNSVSSTVETINNVQQLMKRYDEDYNRQLYNYSSDISVARTLYKDRSLSKYEKFERALSDLVSDINSAIDAYDEQIEKLSDIIENDNSLTDEEKSVLKEQLKQLQARKKQLEEDRKLVSTQTYLSNVWKQAGQDLKEAGKKFKDAVQNLAIDTLVNRFVDPMKEGFQKVYESIESTRNEISARLRLNSGDYKALEETIFAKIDEAGLTGSMSSADVNQLMVGLAQSGITDQELIAELAIQSAKVKAGGGQLDFANEETLQNLLSARSQFGTQQEYFNFIEQIVNTSLGTQQTLMDEFGNYMAVANGNMNKIFNEQLNSFISLGKNLDEFNTDFSTAMYTAQSSFKGGISPDALEQIYQEIKNTAISEQSALGKILSVSGYSVTDLKDASKLDAYNAIQDALINAIGADTQAEYLPYILSTYGINMSADDARKFQNIAKSGGSLTPEDIEAFTSTNDKNAQQISNDIKEGNYLSKTQQIDIAAQNSDIVENGALAAEQLYEGDQVVMNGFQAVENGIKDVVTAIYQASTNSLGYMFAGKGLVSGGNDTAPGGNDNVPTSPGTGTNILNKDFLLGKSKAGKTAATVMGAAGLATMGADTVSYLMDPNVQTAEDWAKLSGDASFMGGAGAAIGSVAGPLGSVIGSAVGTALSTLNPGEFFYNRAQTTAYNDFADAATLAADEITTAAENLLLAANEEYNNAKNQLDTIAEMENWSDSQKQLYMEMHGYTGTFNDMLQQMKDTADAEKEAAEAKLIGSSTAGSYSAQLGSISKDIDFSKVDSNDWGKKVESYLGADAGAFASSILESDDVTTAIQSLGLDSEASMAVSKFVNEFSKRKKIYDSSNDSFQAELKATMDANPDIKDPSELLYAYMKFRGIDYIPTIEWNGDYPAIDKNGLMYLDTDLGRYTHADSLKFETGLTNVPYDNYPALLHTGERILTKEEAKAYNKFSSLAVESLANEYSTVSGDNISSNVFNTAQYGMSDVKTAITSQTNTVESLLNQILQAISTLAGSMRNYNSFGNASSNVIRGNSNVMQLNTM